MPSPRSYVWPLAAVLLSAALLVAGADRGATREAVASLLSTTQTVLGQPIAYPTEAPAKVAAAIVTMQPGEETGWHQHDVPMFGYILEGEVTVDYGAKGTHVYRRAMPSSRQSTCPTTGATPARAKRASSRCSWAPRAYPIREMLPQHPAAAAPQ